jgi:acyl-CoA reductase-like NAD-dependent aldehyde dehydrogenase
LVQECARKLDEHAEELARLMVLETGKALRTECRVEASVHSDVYRYFGGLGSELKGETVPFNPDMLVYTTREPVGVVGAIIAWNVPLLLMALKVAPALVAGNAVVCKSAEEAPLAVLRAAQLCNEILPPGVFNLVSGDGPGCGAPLAEHPLVSKVTLTGSVAAGKAVALAAAKKLIADDRLGRRRPRAGRAGRGHLDALYPPGPVLQRGLADAGSPQLARRIP